MSAGALYFGRVAHRRMRPVAHRLSYRVFSALLDLDRLDELDRSLKIFSRNRFNLFSFYDRDHGHGRPADLAAHIRKLLARAQFPEAAQILLLCYPRILGYAFNPLAIYYCRDAAGRLRTIIYEVRNTFGGRHSYVIPVTDEAEIVQSAKKQLHVSPFMAMETRYDFRLSQPDGDDLSVAILQSDGEGPLLSASFHGTRGPLDDRTLRRAFFAYPLMTVKVIAGIHFEALKLMLKGMKLLEAPSNPAESVTVIRARDEFSSAA
jgi:hypothetical protein